MFTLAAIFQVLHTEVGQESQERRGSQTWIKQVSLLNSKQSQVGLEIENRSVFAHTVRMPGTFAIYLPTPFEPITRMLTWAGVTLLHGLFTMIGRQKMDDPKQLILTVESSKRKVVELLHKSTWETRIKRSAPKILRRWRRRHMGLFISNARCVRKSLFVYLKQARILRSIPDLQANCLGHWYI